MIAYGVYLLHIQILVVLFYFSRHPFEIRLRDLSDGLLILTSLILTLGICVISWRYFEKPLIELGHRFR